MPARFYEQEVSSKLKDKRKLSAFLDEFVTKQLKGIKKASLNYIFCDDDYLLDMNEAFLKHDTYTDIITFNMSETKEELVGEIYISIDRVKENAEKFETTYQNELHRVIFHGALHLCGFKDKKQEDIKEMRRMEGLCLKRYFKNN